MIRENRRQRYRCDLLSYGPFGHTTYSVEKVITNSKRAQEENPACAAAIEEATSDAGCVDLTRPYK
jgi:hypothetical protein